MPITQMLMRATTAFVLERGAVALPVLFLVLLATAVWLLRRGLHGKRGFWRVWRWTGATLCLLAAALSAAAFGFQYRVHQVIDARSAALRLELLSDGSTRTVSDYQGQVVVLNYWATWCPPCRQEMPDVNRLAEAYRDRGVVVVTASDESREVIEQFAAESPFSTENARFSDGAPAPEGAIASMAYQGRPTTLILDREGHLRRFLIGAQSFETLSATVDSLL